MNLFNALARLHQANRRAAAFEARCSQLLEENERLREGLRVVENAMDRDHRLDHGAANCLATVDDLVAGLLVGEDLR